MSKHKINTQALVYPVSLVLVVVVGHYWFHWSDIVVGVILALMIGDHALEKVFSKLDAITELLKAPAHNEERETWSPKCPTCGGPNCVACGKTWSEDYADCPSCGRRWLEEGMCGQRWTEIALKGPRTQNLIIYARD
jgi:hypothetical protein